MTFLIPATSGRGRRVPPKLTELPMSNNFAFNGIANLVLAATPLLAVMLAIYTQAFGQI